MCRGGGEVIRVRIVGAGVDGRNFFGRRETVFSKVENVCLL